MSFYFQVFALTVHCYNNAKGSLQIYIMGKLLCYQDTFVEVASGIAVNNKHISMKGLKQTNSGLLALRETLTRQAFVCRQQRFHVTLKLLKERQFLYSLLWVANIPLGSAHALYTYAAHKSLLQFVPQCERYPSFQHPASLWSLPVLYN